MVNGVGLGFNYDQRIAALKSQLHFSVWSKAIQEDIEFIVQENNNNSQNYSKGIMFPSAQLSFEHEGQMLELIDDVSEQLIFQIQEDIEAIIHINIDHYREVFGGYDRTKLIVFISTIPAN